MSIIKNPVSLDTKYAVADAVASKCNNLSAEVVKANSRFYFREVINTLVIVNNKRATIADMFVEDDAQHITNLVLQRLQMPKLTSSVASVEVDTSEPTAEQA